MTPMNQSEISYERFLNPTLAGLKPSGIRRFFAIASEMEDVITLSIGEPDFTTPWHIREEGIQSLKKGRTWYTPNAGLLRLREAIASFTQRHSGIDYAPKDEILVTVGGSEAIDLGLRAVLSPRDEVLIPEPSFVCYDPLTRMAGGVPVPLVTRAEDAFRLTAEALEAAITPRSKVLVLPGALTYGDTPHVSIASLPGMQERTLLIGGFSKAFAMTGWRLGYVCGPAPIMEQIVKLHQYALMCAPTMAQYAAIEAMENGDPDIECMRGEYDTRRRYIVDKLNRMGLTCFEPEGAFYVFPCIRSSGLNSEDFCQQLLAEKHVAVVPGTAFGDCGEGFVRVSYCYSLEHITEAMHRMEEFLEDHHI